MAHHRILASMLSQNRDVIEAAASAAFINGQAGKTVQKNLGMHKNATDLIDVLPLISKTFDKTK